MHRPKVCAVSYLNTVPLVWGMLHGDQQNLFDLFFRVPAECADLVISGAADIGIIPIYELLGRNLGTVPGVGIACHGEVRSILLVSKCPAEQIRTLAGDSSSRTSVALAQIILTRRYGTIPAVVRRPPELTSMLEDADAALIIGDPALRIDPQSLNLRVYDLGHEWLEMTGLPMVFAVWAGRRECLTPSVEAAFRKSCSYGLANLDRIAALEAPARQFPMELVERYLRKHIVFEFGEAERRGMELYLQYAAALGGANEGRTGGTGSMGEGEQFDTSSRALIK
ncbi:MAG: menaquinone biosynthesis protein [Bryobacteraceae bacterium]